MDVHMIHRRMGMHADLDISKPVPSWRKYRVAVLWRRGISGSHDGFQSLLIRRISSAVAAILAAQLRRSEISQVDNTPAYFGEEGSVCREELERVLGVVCWSAWN